MADAGVRLHAMTTITNENWKGKNDPQERRRIQNRINQRAFRQRRRAGESRAQSIASGTPERHEDIFELEDPQMEEYQIHGAFNASNAHPIIGSSERRPSGVTSRSSDLIWDRLGQLINRNLLSATEANAQRLRINLDDLRPGRPVITPRLKDDYALGILQPVKLQYQVPHDPIIDTIPHMRFRFNILHAIATGKLDSSAFCRSLRVSGAIENTHGQWQRGGLVVWKSAPEQLESWELSEPFVRRWAVLLHDCEDLLAVTNSWRAQRGERPLLLNFSRSSMMI